MSFDWTSTIKLDLLMLKIVGLWPTTKYKFDLYTIYTAIFVNFFITSHVVFHTVQVFIVAGNLGFMMRAFHMALTESLLLLKICYFMYNGQKLKNILYKLNSASFQPKEAQISIVTPSLNRWKKVHKIFALMVANTVLLFNSFPILSGSVKEFRLPVDAWYPYKVEKSPNYQLTYLYQCLSIIFRGICSVGMDTFIAALHTYIGAQCDILCDNLRNLKDEPPETSFNDKLKALIEHHKLIISFAQTSNKFYNGIVLAQFFSTTVAIALGLFLLSLVGFSGSEGHTLMFYLGATITEIFLYCWFGNEVEIKSSQIPYSAFESDWTDISIPAKKNLLIFIMRSQKPIKMSAINLFSLSLATFTTILRTSWSYFAVLRQVNSQE